MLKLSAALIVKDDTELQGLNKALDSLIPFVDGVYVTATGKNVEQIKSLCDLKGVNYSFFKWCDDFSAARNFNFSQVPQDTDFIFWMDADDILIGGQYLREVAELAKQNHKDIVFFTYWYGCTFNGDPSPSTLTEVLMEHNRERLIRPGTHVWKGRLHETPIPVSGAKNNYTKYLYDPKERPIVVMHTSPDSSLEEKMKRNKRILEAQLKDERVSAQGADPRTLLYLMKIYAEAGTEQEMKECIEMGKEYLLKSGWDEERAACHEQIGICWGKLGDFKKSAEEFHLAIAEWPKQPLLYIRLATAYFNLKNYGFADYWMKIGATMDIDNKGSNLTNLKAMKLMYSELLLKMNWNAHRDTKKALEAASLLMKESPTQEHLDQLKFIESFDKLNDACKHVDELAHYLEEIGETKQIVPILEKLPDAITSQPFGQKIRQRFSEPRIWADNEICYFANFGGKFFEEWSGKSLDKGIGGSETAVIELAKRWVEQGYKVTVYGDPGADKGDIEGVTYLPWYYFNPRDQFNIVIQWRNPALAGKIKCKKFYVDMHDIFNQVDFMERLQQIDKIMVKSKYHRNLAPNIPDEKFQIVGNGI